MNHAVVSSLLISAACTPECRPTGPWPGPRPPGGPSSAPGGGRRAHHTAAPSPGTPGKCNNTGNGPLSSPAAVGPLDGLPKASAGQSGRHGGTNMRLTCGVGRGFGKPAQAGLAKIAHCLPAGTVTGRGWRPGLDGLRRCSGCPGIRPSSHIAPTMAASKMAPVAINPTKVPLVMATARCPPWPFPNTGEDGPAARATSVVTPSCRQTLPAARAGPGALRPDGPAAGTRCGTACRRPAGRPAYGW
jgi:hypothetical protein